MPRRHFVSGVTSILQLAPVFQRNKISMLDVHHHLPFKMIEVVDHRAAQADDLTAAAAALDTCFFVPAFQIETDAVHGRGAGRAFGAACG